MSAPATLSPRDADAARRDMSVVSLRGLTKHFAVRRRWVDLLFRPRAPERVTVVQDVTCDVQAGEFFGLLGPNGAGKTTLLKMLATLIVPDEGTATVGGFDIVQHPAAVRRVLTPVISDERSLHWRLSAIENLRLFATLCGVPAREVGGRVAGVLATVGLEGTGAQLVATFSSGMKQRLLIARALLSRPRVLILDEPTRSLDPVSARSFRAFLRDEIVGRQRCTVLLATHNAEEAFELCDRIAVLNRGTLLAVGRASTLARDVADDRYDLWTSQPRHPVLDALTRPTAGAAVPLVHHVRVLDEDDGWTRLRMDVPGGSAQAARVVDVLTCAGVPVARFERVGVSLAELIERIVARAPQPAGSRDA